MASTTAGVMATDSVRSNTVWDDPAVSVRKAVEVSTLQHTPFEHVYMEAVFAPRIYQELLDNLPERARSHSLRHPDALRPDGSSTRLRMYLYPECLSRLPAGQKRVWLQIARALCSVELQAAFKLKFKAALEERFKKNVERIGLYPVPILVRDQPGYRIGIHSDILTKAMTVQFYLPRDSSQQHIGTIFHAGKDGEDALRTTKMGFLPATGYAFPVVAKKSWHSAAQTSDADGERVSVMVTYYVADNLATLMRHRLRRALIFLGLHPKS